MGSFFGAAVLLLVAVAIPLVIFPITLFFTTIFFVFTTVVPVLVSLLKLAARPRPDFVGTGGGAIAVAAGRPRPRSDAVATMGCFAAGRPTGLGLSAGATRLASDTVVAATVPGFIGETGRAR